MTLASLKIYHSYLRSTAMSNTCSFIVNNIYRFRKVHDGINSVIGTVKYLTASNQQKRYINNCIGIYFYLLASWKKYFVCSIAALAANICWEKCGELVGLLESLLIPPVAADFNVSGSVGPPWLHLPFVIDVGSSVHEKKLF